MKNTKILCAFILLFFVKNNYAQVPSFNFGFPFSSDFGSSNITDTETLSNGDFVISGQTAGGGDLNPSLRYSVDFDVSYGSYFVAYYSFDGTLKWYRQFTGNGNAGYFFIDSDNAGNIYICFSSLSAVTFVDSVNTITVTPIVSNKYCLVFAKYNSAGQLEWAQIAGGNQDVIVKSITCDNNGEILFTGYFDGTIDFDCGPGIANLSSTGNKGFVAKYNGAGNYLDARPLDIQAHNYSKVLVDNANNYYLLGEFINNLDIDLGTAVQNISSNGGGDVFVIKTNSNFQLIWGKHIGGTLSENFQSGKFDKNGQLVISGTYDPNNDFDPSAANFTLPNTGYYFARYDTALNFMTAVGIAIDIINLNLFYPIDFDFDNQNNIIVGSHYTGTIDIDPGASTVNVSSVLYNGSNTYDLMVLKLSSSFQYLSHDLIGRTGNEYCSGINVDNYNHLWVSGFSSTGEIDVDLGSDTLIYNHISGPWDQIAFGVNYYLCSPLKNTRNINICKDQFYVFGTDTLTKTGIYKKYFSNPTGCDSLITVNLNVKYLDLEVYTNDSILVCKTNGALYQWINCSSNLTVGAANSFMPTDNDSYAVIIQKNGCTDTTECIYRFANANKGVPQLEWAYNSIPEFTSFESALSTDWNENLYVPSVVGGIKDVDMTSSVTFMQGEGSGLASYKPSGNLSWAQSFSPPLHFSNNSWDGALSTAVDMNNNVVVFGFYDNDFDVDPGIGVTILPSFSTNIVASENRFLAKYNEQGDLIWGREILPVVGMGHLMDVHKMQIDSIGDIYVCGSLLGAFDFEPGPGSYILSTNSTNNCIFIAKYSSGGNLLWAFFYPNTAQFYNMAAKSCVIDAAGNLIVTGSFIGTIDFDPGPGIFNLSAVPFNSDVKLFVAKYSPSGQLIWAKTVYSIPEESGESIDILSNGTILVGRKTFTNNKILLYDSAGTIFPYFFGTFSSGDLIIEEISVSKSGNVYILADLPTSGPPAMIGQISLPSNGGFAIAKLSKTGVAQWAFPIHNLGYGDMTLSKKDKIYFLGSLVQTPIDVQPGPGIFNINPVSGYISLTAKYSEGCAAIDTTLLIYHDSVKVNTPNSFYEWHDCTSGNLISSTANQTFYPPYSGNFYVTIGQGSCSVSTPCHSIITPIQEASNSNGLWVYPTVVTTHNFNIGLKDKNNRIYSLMIYDSNGKLILKRNEQLGNTEDIVLPNLRNGLYTVLVNSTDLNSYSKRFVIQK